MSRPLPVVEVRRRDGEAGDAWKGVLRRHVEDAYEAIGLVEGQDDLEIKAENVGYWSGVNDLQLHALFIADPRQRANVLGPHRRTGAAWATTFRMRGASPIGWAERAKIESRADEA